MTKRLFVDPNDVRSSGFIKFEPIPVNQYNRSVAQERANFSDDALRGIYRDMAIIREFETMLNSIKRTGEYNGLKCGYGGTEKIS